MADAEMLRMPWIVTGVPRLLASGGAEVAGRADGERSVRPIPGIEGELIG